MREYIAKVTNVHAAVGISYIIQRIIAHCKVSTLLDVYGEVNVVHLRSKFLPSFVLPPTRHATDVHIVGGIGRPPRSRKEVRVLLSDHLQPRVFSSGLLSVIVHARYMYVIIIVLHINYCFNNVTFEELKYSFHGLASNLKNCAPRK